MFMLDSFDRFIHRKNKLDSLSDDILKDGKLLLDQAAREIPRDDGFYENEFSGQYVTVYVKRKTRPSAYHTVSGRRSHPFNPCFIRLTYPDGRVIENFSDTILDVVSKTRAEFIRNYMEA